jgi:hypothetical protein
MMNMVNNKRTNRKNKMMGMIYKIILPVVMFFVTSFAGTSSVHTNMLYQHAYFADKHWRITSDLIGYTLSPAYMALTPVKSSFAENDTNSIALFSASDNKLYLMSVALKPETAENKAVITARDPVVSPAGSAGSPLEVFALAANKIDTVFIATVSGTDKVLIHHISTQNYSETKVDTLTITPPSGSYAIQTLVGGPDVAISGQSGVWVTGSYGLVRYFEWNGSSWGSEVIHDIDTSETVTALCKEALGTSAGKIYEFESNSFVFKSQPGIAPINSISPLGAVSSGGKIIKKKGTDWVLFVAGSGNYKYFNFIARTDGSGVELLDDAWKFYVYTLEDTLTKFDIVQPDVAQHINNGKYLFHYILDPKDIDITLIDPDGNCIVPQIKLNNSTDLVDSLENMHPDTLWSLGYTDLVDTMITMTLTRDSIIISAETRRGAFNPVTYKKSWIKSLFRSSVQWFNKDQIMIKLGDDSLLIEYDSIPVTVINNVNKNILKELAIQRSGAGLTFTMQPNTIHQIRVFNLLGRQIVSTRVSPGANRVTISLHISSGMLCVEYILTNGKAIRETLPVIR